MARAWQDPAISHVDAREGEFHIKSGGLSPADGPSFFALKGIRGHMHREWREPTEGADTDGECCALPRAAFQCKILSERCMQFHRMFRQIVR